MLAHSDVVHDGRRHVNNNNNNVFQAADDAERAGWIKAILDAKAKAGKATGTLTSS